MGVSYRFTEYDAGGEVVGGGAGFMPKYLDWMPIEAKVFWYRYMSVGNPQTEYVLLNSQGEQRLIVGVSLARVNHEEYKEKVNGAEEAVNGYIDREGICRTPRNQ